jgi:lactate dehydrogenase-like 2-hydroxyacid dehydrogenase
VAPTQVLIASPLEAELAASIQAADPRAEVLFEPELLPPARYPADHRGDPAFRRDPGAEARWRALLDRAEVLFGVPGDSADDLAEVVTTLPRLRWVHATSAGAGELPRFVEDQRARAWPEVRRPLRELDGQTLFLVGLGDIGLETARLGKAFGMRTVGFRRTEGPPPEHVDEVHGPRRLAELAGRADAMVVSLPLTDQTAGLIDRATIEALPPSCIFVNVGRGGVVDEPALVDALGERRIAGAVLDVFATEPLPDSSPLWTLPNVLVTPHAAALSARENERIVELFCDNLRRYLDGQPLRNVVEPGVYY